MAEQGPRGPEHNPFIPPPEEVSPLTTPETYNAREYPREYVRKIFQFLERVDPKEFTRMVTVEKRLRVIRLWRENRPPELSEEEMDEIVYEAVVDSIELGATGIDRTTGLPNRDLLNEAIKLSTVELIGIHNPEEREIAMKRIGAIEFDVRGLKVVNDASKNHAVGDAFLKRIAEESAVISSDVFLPVLGRDTDIKLYRDGGDEFCFLMKNSGLDLHKMYSQEEVLKLFPETVDIYYPRTGVQSVPVREIALEVFDELLETNEQTEVRLMPLMSRLFQTLLATRTCEDILPTRLIRRHLRKGNEDYQNAALEGFKMQLLVAAGDVTFFEAFQETTGDDIKEGFKVEERSVDQNVTQLMSIVRLCADRRSNDEKDNQNLEWVKSNEPLQRLYLDLMSRNSITVALSQELIKERALLLEQEQSLKDLKELRKLARNILIFNKRVELENRTLIEERAALIQKSDKEKDAVRAENQTLQQRIVELETVLRELEEDLERAEHRGDEKEKE